jgi:hypothetical protein
MNDLFGVVIFSPELVQMGLKILAGKNENLGGKKDNFGGKKDNFGGKL